MTRTGASKLAVISIGLIFSVLSAVAGEVEVTKTTDLFGSGPNNKPKKIGSAHPGERYKIISTKGNWVAINYKGKSVWISAKNVKTPGESDSADREPAGESFASATSGPIAHPFSVHADLGIQTGGTGFAPGIGAYYKLTRITPSVRLDVGPTFFFFPSAGGGVAGASSSAFEILLNARALHPIASKMQIGGEFGFALLNSSTTVGTTSVSGTSLGLNLGGTFTYEISRNLVAVANARLIFAGGTGALFTGGVEYSF